MSTLVKQAKFGRSCQKCKSYFVTENEGAHICPWCERIESGQVQPEAFELELQ